ncbi:MAG: DUF421 domain-containing protein [Eubacteriales bacterium]|nr:DUF421 domain-containing protein [Eubacteriales bacterium]
MAISFCRTIILYTIVMCAVRLMGKKQAGELEPMELAVTFMISDLASIPMQDMGIPLLAGVIPILTILIIEIFFSMFSMKNKTFRRFLSGKPSVLIYDGKIMLNEMRKNRFNRDDLMEQLRLGGTTNINEVRYAILETNGQLSVILKKDNQPATVKDLQNTPPQKSSNKKSKSKK